MNSKGTIDKNRAQKILIAIFIIIIISGLYAGLFVTSAGIYLGAGKEMPLHIDGYVVDANGEKSGFGQTIGQPSCDYLMLSNLSVLTVSKHSIYTNEHCPFIYIEYRYVHMKRKFELLFKG